MLPNRTIFGFYVLRCWIFYCLRSIRVTFSILRCIRVTFSNLIFSFARLGLGVSLTGHGVPRSTIISECICEDDLGLD